MAFSFLDVIYPPPAPTINHFRPAQQKLSIHTVISSV
jgi:hypothetical protein